MKRKKSLESIVKRQDNHVKHFDPAEAIHHHVVFVIFIAMMFLMGIFMFLMAEPGDPTAYAIVQFEPITIHHDIANSVSGFIDNVRHSENRPLVLLALYTFWIVIFGLINMVLYERQLRK